MATYYLNITTADGQIHQYGAFDRQRDARETVLGALAFGIGGQDMTSATLTAEVDGHETVLGEWVACAGTINGILLVSR